MNLNEKLFELRKNKNLTQDEVAEKLNVTRQTVSKWENGQSSPDFDKIAPLCEIYDVTPNELFSQVPEFEQKENKKAKKEISYEEMTNAQIKQKTAEVISGAILLFIVAVAFLFVGAGFLNLNATLCFSIFIIILGIGVSIIVKHFMSIPEREKTEEEKKEKSVLKQIEDIVGAIGLSLYFIISFATMAWHITWIIFIIIGLINQVIKLVFSLKGIKEEKEDE